MKAFVLEAISYFVVGEALTFYQHLDNHNLYLKTLPFLLLKLMLQECPFCRSCSIIVSICCCESLVNRVFVLLFNVIYIAIEMATKMIIEMDRKYSFSSHKRSFLYVKFT